nr:immunoglobulin heavy chain junction region [Macaca mulatta]
CARKGYNLWTTYYDFW